MRARWDRVILGDEVSTYGGVAMAKRRRGQPGVNKTQFILQQPFDIPAKEVVKRAQEQGIELTEKYVHIIRSKARKGQAAPGRRRGRPPKAATAAASAADTAVQQFRRLALTIGLARAEDVLKDLRQRVEQIIK